MCELDKVWLISGIEILINITVDHSSGHVTVTVESESPLLKNIRIHTEVETFWCDNNNSSIYSITGTEQCDIISSRFHSEIIGEFWTEDGEQAFLNGSDAVGKIVSLCSLETVDGDITNDYVRARMAELDADPMYYWVEDQTYIYYN